MKPRKQDQRPCHPGGGEYLSPGSFPGAGTGLIGPNRARLRPETKYAPEALLTLFPKARNSRLLSAASLWRLHAVAMVTLGSLLSNRPELQEVAKVFSHVLKQMDVYLSLECKYTVGGKENIYTQTTY